MATQQHTQGALTQGALTQKVQTHTVGKEEETCMRACATATVTWEMREGAYGK